MINAVGNRMTREIARQSKLADALERTQIQISTGKRLQRMSDDPVAARRFYGDQFGWTSDNFMPMGEQGEYRFFEHNGVTIGAVAGTTEGGQPHWRYYFRVPSIAKAKETAEAKGGTIRVGPMEVPGGDFIIIGTDPQGAEFAFVGRQ